MSLLARNVSVALGRLLGPGGGNRIKPFDCSYASISQTPFLQVLQFS